MAELRSSLESLKLRRDVGSAAISAGRPAEIDEALDGVMDDAVDEPLFVEDLLPGQVWVSPLREISGEDVRVFAELTGDHDPLHESSTGLASPFGQPVAHGLLGLSVLAGLGTRYPRAATLALVGLTDWQFLHPIFFGQRVRVETTIESIQPHGRRAGRVVWLRQLKSDDGRTLQSGRFVTLVAARLRVNRQPR